MTESTHLEKGTTPMSKTKIRLVGLAVFLMGTALGYYFVYLKWLAIRALEPTVNYHLKIMFLVPFSIVLGLYYLLFAPSNGGAWKQLSSKERPILLIALVIAIVLSALLFIWFKSQLSKYGYQ
jgi:lipoprotein signal peptidase